MKKQHKEVSDNILKNSNEYRIVPILEQVQTSNCKPRKVVIRLNSNERSYGNTLKKTENSQRSSATSISMQRLAQQSSGNKDQFRADNQISKNLNVDLTKPKQQGISDYQIITEKRDNNVSAFDENAQIQNQKNSKSTANSTKPLTDFFEEMINSFENNDFSVKEKTNDNKKSFHDSKKGGKGAKEGCVNDNGSQYKRIDIKSEKKFNVGNCKDLIPTCGDSVSNINEIRQRYIKTLVKNRNRIKKTSKIQEYTQVQRKAHSCNYEITSKAKRQDNLYKTHTKRNKFARPKTQSGYFENPFKFRDMGGTSEIVQQSIWNRIKSYCEYQSRASYDMDNTQTKTNQNDMGAPYSKRVDSSEYGKKYSKASSELIMSNGSSKNGTEVYNDLVHNTNGLDFSFICLVEYNGIGTVEEEKVNISQNQGEFSGNCMHQSIFDEDNVQTHEIFDSIDSFEYTESIFS
ncbi:hypothetical protein BB560_000662 [Smittium megazygosporum]|uniref:Uncharacterized protein n=1 Tax=Smittium megazygosporum TaxID=133381 RepID=A0A2T9ZJN8_9FUNG|nr:hypothetical protein BB560_000662 [Smittium megazygosporum]